MPSAPLFNALSNALSLPADTAQTNSGYAHLDIAGVIGAELAEPLSHMQQIVSGILESGKISRRHVKQLGYMIEGARKTAMQSQQLARLANGRLRQSHEKLRLDILLTQALAENLPRLQAQDILLQQHIQPVDVIFDPGLLTSLIDASIDWISLRGHQLNVSLSLQNPPEFSLLRFTANPRPESALKPETPPEFEKLSWYLLMEVTRTMGVKITRTVSATETVLNLEFQRSTPPPLEALDHAETRSRVDSWQMGGSSAINGTAPLLVTDDAKLRRTVETICLNMGMELNCAANSTRAARYCAQERPPLMIYDERCNDDVLETLQSELTRHDPNFPFIEIVDESKTLMMSTWMSDTITRVNIENLRTMLPRALMTGLSRKRTQP